MHLLTFYIDNAHNVKFTVMNKIFQIKTGRPSLSAIVKSLEDPSFDRTTNLPPVKPKGGEMFIYKPTCCSEEGKDIKIPIIYTIKT